MSNSVEIKQQKFIEDFNSLEDALWQNEFLLRLAGNAQSYPIKYKDETHLLKGCQSEAWICCGNSEDYSTQTQSDIFFMNAESDALIVKGMLQIIAYLTNDKKVQDVATAHFTFLEDTDLINQISSDRFKGMKSALRLVQKRAAEIAADLDNAVL